MVKVFLGGTTNDSDWRERLIAMLNVEYFNPIVDNWDEEAQQEELKQRELCTFVLYVVTPRMMGLYSIAEVVDDSNKQPQKTLFCILKEDTDNGKRIVFLPEIQKSFDAIKVLVEKNGARVFDNLEDLATFLNQFVPE